MYAESLDFNPSAVHEAIEAREWYRRRSENAALRFEKEFERACLAIQGNPDGWPKYKFRTRYKQLKRFPYLVIYRLRDDSIEVVAVSHAKRRSAYWRNRINP